MSPKKKAERESRRQHLARHIADRNQRWRVAVINAMRSDGLSVHIPATEFRALADIFNAIAYESETGETPDILK